MKQIIAAVGLILLFAISSALHTNTNAFSLQQAVAQDTASLKQSYRAELDKWMLEAYEGDRDAQFKVGVLFTNTESGLADQEQAVYWYKQAARQGHVLAQYNLGHQYISGLGVQKNESQAMKWWLEAAKRDHALAQFNVGRGYYLGIGLPKDAKTAVAWFQRAADNEEPKSIDILAKLRTSEPELFDGSNTSVAVIEPIIEPKPGKAQVASNDANSASGRDVQSSNLSAEQADRAGSTIAITNSLDQSGIKTQKDAKDNSQNNSAIQSNVVQRETLIEPTKAQEPSIAEPRHNKPIPVFTNPAIRPILITILDSSETIRAIEEQNEWIKIQSTDGLPAWIHQDFLKVRNGIGTVNGNNVNIRAVPLLTNGSKIGQLDSGEQVTVIRKKDNWYNIVSPNGLTAWVKSTAYNEAIELLASNTDNGKESNAENQAQVAERSEQSDSQPAEANTNSNYNEALPVEPGRQNQQLKDESNDDWLFAQNEDSYTLQLASFDDQLKVDEFLAKPELKGNPELRVFSSKSNGVKWVYFLYGSYSDATSAERAKAELGQKNAWIRSIGLLRQKRCVSWKRQLPTPRKLNKYCAE